MNALRNKVQLIGNLGKDPQVMEVGSGVTLVRFSVATTEYYKSSKGTTRDTQWHAVTAWGKTGELAARLLKKGSLVALEGRLVSRSYEDKQGHTRNVTEIRLNDFLVLKESQA
ncbi:MAG: single-stranded DNA-binding protein [Flavobacteriales bacterium]|nr:single-stranded DNA-binding protein [Flavobacteriales bacterium]MCX7651128.1 single-stranded DNA-binding protein [Flavobacteriales bacterium]MDW8431416.1 single-stranded DNA-binding protein [Flavobacteriales bacterium]